MNFRSLFKVGLITATVIVLYQLSNILLVYHYFRYEYYLLGIAVFALITGILLTNKYHREKLEELSACNPLDTLTAKELLILSQLSEGKTNKEIAALNYVELSTVKTHINNIFAKLAVNSRKEAGKLYRQHTQIAKSTFSPPKLI